MLVYGIESSQKIYYPNTVLHLKGYDATSGQTFADYSQYNKTITTHGNVSYSTTQKKWGDSSIYFDGNNGSYLSVLTSTDFDLVNVGDFSIELWLYPLTTNERRGLIGTRILADGGFVVTQWQNNFFSVFFTGGSRIFSSSTIISNTWQHLAVIRKLGIVTLFHNGINVGSANFTNGLSTTEPLRIGCEDANGDSTFKGFISDLRIIKSFSAYSSSFLVPEQPLITSYPFEFNDLSGLSVSRPESLTNSLNESVIEQRPQMSLLHGGKGVVSGTTVKVPSDIPVARKVRLFEEKSGLLIQEVWSDAQGNYLFSNLSDNYYFITAHDHTLEFNGVIQSHVRPEFPV